jgi:hypothetical protein
MTLSAGLGSRGTASDRELAQLSCSPRPDTVLVDPSRLGPLRARLHREKRRARDLRNDSAADFRLRGKAFRAERLNSWFHR